MGDINLIEVERKAYFYDAAIARTLIQVGAKIFGGYQVASGYQTDGKIRMSDVPVIFAGWSRVVEQLFAGISDNTIIKLPIISYSLTSLQRKVAEIRDPRAIQQYKIRVRKRDSDGNLMVNEPGEILILERYMPVPYEMEIELAIWASNYDQLFQIVEQFGSQFNPDLEFAISDAPLDWTSPTRILHAGGFRIEEYTAEKPDTALVTRANFNVTTRLSLPARVYDATLIHEIDVNFKQLDNHAYYYFGDNLDIPQMPTLDKLVVLATAQQIEDLGNQ